MFFKLNEEIKLFQKSLIIKNKLIISDLHIGIEEYYHEKGFLIPKDQSMKHELKEILETVKPKEVIIAGDLKHEFGTISKQEWFDTLEILDMILQYSKVTLVKGNHDNILLPIANKKGLDIKEYYFFDKYLVIHGHKDIKHYNNDKIKKIWQQAKYIVMGHEHPAITIVHGVRSEKFKCFLVCDNNKTNKTIIVLPSFNNITEGYDLTKSMPLSEIIKSINYEKCKVYVTEGKEIFEFGSLNKIIKHNRDIT